MSDRPDHDLTPTEARQGEKRRTPRRALIWGTIIAFIVLALIWAFWVQSTAV
jgi:hypothetical protein